MDEGLIEKDNCTREYGRRPEDFPNIHSKKNKTQWTT